MCWDYISLRNIFMGTLNHLFEKSFQGNSGSTIRKIYFINTQSIKIKTLASSMLIIDSRDIL